MISANSDLTEYWPLGYKQSWQMWRHSSGCSRAEVSAVGLQAIGHSCLITWSLWFKSWLCTFQCGIFLFSLCICGFSTGNALLPQSKNILQRFIGRSKLFLDLNISVCGCYVWPCHILPTCPGCVPCLCPAVAMLLWPQKWLSGFGKWMDGKLNSHLSFDRENIWF